VVWNSWRAALEARLREQFRNTMPIYAYVCQECGADFQVRRKIAEMDEPAACPECGATRARRQISVFYATNTGTSTAAASSPATRVRHI
jgi:putative FmdB family regulatory protein